ncbi:MAG: hypothetical protein AB1778_10050, partial [Candidatus Bipolaricaulota bacterium]
SRVAEELSVESPEDGLLADVEPENFVVRLAPTVTTHVPGITVLSLGGMPVLWRADLPDRRVVLLAPTPMETNLPLTVDFPILMENALRWLALASPSTPAGAFAAGDAIAFSPYGTPIRLREPSGREVEVNPEAFGFLARSPGLYELTAQTGVFPIAVNVAGGESPHPSGSGVVERPGETPVRLDEVLVPLWPLATGAALLFLAAESVAFLRGGLIRRRR